MNQKTKSAVIHRLSIAEGHLKKVKQMLEEDKYCPDVIHQSRAVQAALKKVDEIVLSGHLNSCVLKGLPGSVDKKEQLVKEIVEIFEKKP